MAIKRDFLLPEVENLLPLSVYSFEEGVGCFFNPINNLKGVFIPMKDHDSLPSWVKKVTEEMKMKMKTFDIKNSKVVIFSKKEEMEELDKKIISSFESNKLKSVTKFIPLSKFWEEGENVIIGYKLSGLFGFMFCIKDVLDSCHIVQQIQFNYTKQNEYALIEILKFCHSPTITDDLLVSTVLTYISTRKDKMKYKNLVKKINLEDRYAIIVSGTNIEDNEKFLENFDKRFKKWLTKLEYGN